MGRKIRIVRRRVVEVSEQVFELLKTPSQCAAYCLWCQTPKAEPKKKCERCGQYGNTSQPILMSSSIYMEEI